MRERLAKVRIEAATLAGGKVNQDYYAYGETYALVLDGASSFLPESTSIDAATYVKALGEALAVKLESCKLNEIPNIVARAIEEVAKKYKLVEHSSPSSTIVITKWNYHEVLAYVLGDSACLLIDEKNKIFELIDNRISIFGNSIRKNYQQRLRNKNGFDDNHKELLRKLQKVQKDYRNIEDGYWIASSTSEAAYKGYLKKEKLNNIKKIILATDGGRDCLGGSLAEHLEVDLKSSLSDLIGAQHQKEESDYLGVVRPRSKIHDDKTIVVIDFNKC